MKSHGLGNYVAKNPKKDDKEQSKQFIDKAKELGTDKSGKKFNKAVDNIAEQAKTKQRSDN